MRYKEFVRVFEDYVNTQKPLREYRSIKQAQQQIIKTLSGLQADNQEHAKILDKIYKIINTDNIGGKMDQALIPPQTDEKLAEPAKQKIRQDKRLINFISDFHKKGKVIACICSGAQLLISAKCLGISLPISRHVSQSIDNAGGLLLNPKD